jgi:hypothetical protein
MIHVDDTLYTFFMVTGKLMHILYFLFVHMNPFHYLELKQFVHQRSLPESSFCEKRFHANEEEIQTFLTHDHILEYLPSVLIYLKQFYCCADTMKEINYLNERIEYYELLLSYTKQRDPPVPKNVLRRRNIQKN